MTLLAPERQPAVSDRPQPRPRRRFDLLRVPVVGRFLRWRWSRVTLQIPMLLVSLVMIAHAFFGPQLAPKNLAALLTWVHFRGLVVLVLLLAGNFFCMACPFMLPRQLARTFINPRWQWPRKLRNKWPAIVLFVGVLFAYELFDLWGDPWWTGALIVGYFAAAFGVDALFQRASFCKYVCPVGQFNFLGSTLSPLEVAVRDPEVCVQCTTKDCIRGRREVAAVAGFPHSVSSLLPSRAGRMAGGEGHASEFALTPTPLPGGEGLLKPVQADLRSLPIIQRGCELALFQPRKVGNLDCTFCLDCVYACPHENVGILSRLPGETLADGGMRSGIGSLDRRSDWTVLSIVFVFGALLNAFAMVSPVYALERGIASATGLTVEWPILGFLFAAALVLEPALLLGGAAAVTRRVSGKSSSLWQIVNRFSRSLVPLGFGVWLAHYGFHFFTGVLTVVPVTQNAARAAGWPVLGEPQWQLGGLPEAVVFPMELGFLGLGLIGSLLVGWRIAAGFDSTSTAKAFAPWGAVSVLLFVSACWILWQPMDMRGTFLGVGG